MISPGLIVLLIFLAGVAEGDRQVRDGEFHGQLALILSNDRIELRVLPNGGSTARSVPLPGGAAFYPACRHILHCLHKHQVIYPRI